ncbi:hypothetical protein PHMEG_00039823, partial [Phytophthora megakarya]
HCPPETRALIVGELSDLKTSRNKTVRKYTRQFRGLLRMLPFADEYDPIADTDLVRMYKDGLPIHWQLEINRLYRTWDLNGMILQCEIIERNEREEEMLRGRQRGQANKNKPGRASAVMTTTATVGLIDHRDADSKTAPDLQKSTASSEKTRSHPGRVLPEPNGSNYRPRGGQAGPQRDDAIAAMQEQVSQMAAMMEAMKKRQDEKFNAVRLYREDAMNVFAVNNDAPTNLFDEVRAPPQALHLPAKAGGDLVMETEVLIGGHRFRALIDTGCTSSALETKCS